MKINDDIHQTNEDGNYDKEANNEQDEFNLIRNNAMLEEFQDNGLKTFVMQEGPNQIINLLLEE